MSAAKRTTQNDAPCQLQHLTNLVTVEVEVEA